MDDKQYNRLLKLLALCFIGVIFAIRAVSEAVTGDETWRIVYSGLSLVAWVYGTGKAFYG